MDTWSFTVLLAGQVVGYLIGGIPFGYLVTRWKTGQDIRQQGSGNIGATNVGRVLGLHYFLLVFFLDFCKGALPVLGALMLRERIAPPATFLPEVVGFAAILGHVFPIYLHMRGGKGVATTMGVLVCLAPVATLVGLAAWSILVLATRMISVGSIGFATALVLTHFLRTPEPFSTTVRFVPLDSPSHKVPGLAIELLEPVWPNLALSTVILLVAVLVVARHLGNIRRIVAGTEPRIRMPWTKEADGV